MKTNVRKLLIAGAVGASWLAASPASAQLAFGRMDTGLYLGAGVGQSRGNVDTTGIAGSKDENDVGFKVFAGYRFHRNVAVEAGYYDLGKLKFSGALAGAIPPFAAGTAVSGSSRTRAGAVSVVGIMPLGSEFSLLGKLGVSYSRQTTDISVGGLSGSVKDNATELTYGLGARYDFTPNVGVRAEWERFRVGGNNGGGKNDIDLYSVNLLYTFH